MGDDADDATASVEVLASSPSEDAMLFLFFLFFLFLLLAEVDGGWAERALFSFGGAF